MHNWVRSILLLALLGAAPTARGEAPALLIPPEKPGSEAAASEPSPEPPAEPEAQVAAPTEPEVGKTESVPDGGVGRPDPRALCLLRLRERGVVFERLAPTLDPKTGCGSSMPLSISAIGAVPLTPAAELNCAMATTLTGWVEQVDALARKEFGEPLAGLAVGGGAECRPRNRVAGGKPSEHSFANAVDIMAFTFAGHAGVTVKPAGYPGDAADRFLAQAWQLACDLFTTVLGPGADAMHSDNLHLDLAWRRSGYRMCQ